ncbi:MAG: TonB-dependent receptor [Tannerellaceae bacterium]|jgi:TonB-linked SusC/RagA family outer membrane protein|nr:TonB-dependent receptor [Tannerellaceae bacterium]
MKKTHQSSLLGLLGLLLLFPALAWGQTKTVTGIVKDASGESIIGASVLETGTTNGTITGLDGDFTLTVSPSATLTISYVGYVTQVVDVSGRNHFDILLKDDSKALEEVVVIGYGVQRKEAVTGSVASMAGKELLAVPAGNVSQALQGRVAGVDMSQTSSRPGAEMRIRIRGTRSLSADNDPLIVLDGIPFMGSLSDINPSVIKSVDILKDASATAIYGSRGANGVVLVTTHKGEAGVGKRSQVSYNGYHGWKTLFAPFPMMGTDEYIAFKEAAGKNGSSYGLDQVSADEDPSGQTETDWQDLMFQSGMVTSHDLAVSNAMEKGAYSFSTGYYKEETVLPGQDFSRLSLRGSFDQGIGRVKLGVATQSSYGITNGSVNNPMGPLLSLSPLIKPYDDKGNLKEIVSVSAFPHINPLLLEEELESGKSIDQRKTFASYNSLYGEVDIWGGLKYRMNVGLNYRRSDYGNFVGRGSVFKGADTGGGSVAYVENTLQTNWAVENLLYYDKVFADKHILNVVAMYSAEQTEYEASRMDATDIPADYMQYHNLGLALGDKLINSEHQKYWQRGLVSYMGRASYNYDNRYMLSATVRHDEASVLAQGYQGHTYPAVSVGWNIKSEPFMKSVHAIDLLKLRVGYGETSNQAVSPYATAGGLGVNYYNFGLGGTSNQYGYYVNTLPNNRLGWEYSTTWNFGVDFRLFGNILTGSLEYYTQNTHDILQQLSLPPTAGVDGSYWANVGRTRNQGLEFSANAAIIRNLNGWSWDVGVNLYGNRNEIVQLASGRDRDIDNGWFVGSPIDVIYDYKKIGVWQENDPMGEVTDFEGENGKTGMIKVEYTGEYDANGKPVRRINDEDKQILGHIAPDLQGGFNTRLAYKNIDLTIVGAFQAGGMLVSSLYAPWSYRNTLNGRWNNVSINYWTPENKSNDAPGPNLIITGDNLKYSATLAYFDASYLKFRTITLGYNFDGSWLEKAGISSARIYATVQNPFVLFAPYTDFSGMDPETNSGSRENQSVASSSTQPERQLTVAYNTPATRNYLLGLSVTF